MTEQKRLLCSQAGIPPKFSKPILANPQISPDDLLAELARNYSRKGKVKNPGYITGLNLAKDSPEKAAAEWYEQAKWLAHLPDLLRSKLGLEFQSQSEGLETLVEMATRISATPDETVEKSLDGHMSPAQAWQSALEQLQAEMTKGSFNTWVRDAVAVHYEEGVFTIAAHNSYARDWLENRLSSTAKRMLMGIMNRNVDIRFVIQEEWQA